MIKIYDAQNIALSDILLRDNTAQNSADAVVDDIIANVRARGDAALYEYCERFDSAKLTSLKVSDAEIEAALAQIEPQFLAILEEARDNIAEFHAQQLQKSFVLTRPNGAVMGQKITPIEKAGIYVPGGTASYPSSVLMNIIPCRLAGVSDIIMVSPPDKNGCIAPAILAAAKIAGATAIYKIGGAQAVAALAYGTESIPKVDKIVGPGNIFVATAKRKVYGAVDIDMIAGPSEILVVADDTCDAKIVAADMLGQAEHDKLATSVLITDSRRLAEAVAMQLEEQLKTLPREEIARASIDNNGKIILVSDLAQGIDIANAIAPEHLEICVDEPFALLDAIKNAGSIFLGKNSPEALGDYFAGPNHVLPTNGAARFSSPLSVDDFIKKSSYLYYPAAALRASADKIVTFAEREGLYAHGRSVSLRFEK